MQMWAKRSATMTQQCVPIAIQASVPLSFHPLLSHVGTDLLQVAAHEFGHVLGLQHSLEPGSVMSPFYSDSYPLQLSEDDIRGIQFLYGAPVHAPPEMSNDIHDDIVRQHISTLQLRLCHCVFISYTLF